MDLAAIVELWRATLDPATSLAACNLAAVAPPQAWPEKAEARQQAWLQQARRPAGHEPELMREFDFVKLKSAHVIERFDAMAAWDPHPVVARWLVELFARQTRAPILAGQKLFRRVFGLLEAHVDLDGAARLRGWIGTHQQRIGASEYGCQFFDAGIARVLKKGGPRLAAVRPLTAAERAALERAGLLDAVGPAVAVTTETLLAAVYEAPWDDTPRQVLGDFLQERGDPRGEFIALDLLPSPTPEQLRRRTALLKQHGRSWFPPAIHRTVLRSAAYERGFLASGVLISTRTPIELSTFRELVIQETWPEFDHPVFRGIDTWRGLWVLDEHSPHRARFAACGPLPRVQRVALSASFHHEPAAIAATLRAETWPSLTEVAVEARLLGGWDRPAVPGWIDEVAAGLGAALPHLSRLQIFGIATYVRDGGALRLAKISLPSQITDVLCDDSPSRISVGGRDRWFRWIAERDAPIHTYHPAELRHRLPREAGERIHELRAPGAASPKARRRSS